MFEDKQRDDGKPVSHQFAKELLVGLAGVEADRLAETKGEDFIDRERTKHSAKKNVCVQSSEIVMIVKVLTFYLKAEHMYDDHYGGQDQYDPQQQRPHQRLQEEHRDNRW